MNFRTNLLMLVPPAAITMLLISACSVGPRYARPVTPAPPAFKEATSGEFKEQAGWKIAEPNDTAVRGDWWTVFGDAELNSLEAQVHVSNQNVAAAAAQFRYARDVMLATRSKLFPFVSTSPSYIGFYYPVMYDPLGQVTLPIDFRYEADVWGRIRKSVSAAKANAQARAADLATVQLSIQAELAYDYFQLRGADEAKRVMDRIREEYQHALELTQDRFRKGIASREDVVQAQSQVDAARVQDIDIGVQRDQLEHAIAVLIGKAPAEFSIAPASFNRQLPAIPVALPSQLIERRPDIASAERQVAAANDNIGVAKSAYFPAILLSATLGFQSTDLSQTFASSSEFWSVGPTLFETIFDKGRRRAITDEARASYEAAVANYRQTVLDAFQGVEDDLAALRILSDESVAQARATASAQERLDLALANYEVRNDGFLNVVTAQNAVFSQRIAEVTLQTRRMTACVLLVKALGGGWDTSQLPTARELRAKR